MENGIEHDIKLGLYRGVRDNYFYCGSGFLVQF